MESCRRLSVRVAAWRAQKEKIEQELPKLREFQGALGVSQDAGRRAGIHVAPRQGAVAALRLRQHAVRQDTRLSGLQGMQQEMQQLFAKFGAEAAFVEQILKVGSRRSRKPSPPNRG